MKKFWYLCVVFACVFLTGCLKRDSMEDISIYTSVYPIEYIVDRLYGDNSTIYSIYPNGVIPSMYSLNEKQIRDFSKYDLFVFNGLGNEKDYLDSMLKNNSNLKIIDATSSMEYTNNYEELWFDPGNALMIARNVKTGLNEYINNHYIQNEVEKNYELLKIDFSNLSAKLSLVSESSDDATLIVSKDFFKFLEKYGFNIISLDNNVSEKDISIAKQRIQNGDSKHIFVIKGEEVNPIVQSIIDETGVQKLEIHSLANINDTERNNKNDYISIMNENINLFKQELYK